jgi:hypothetical protein
MGLNPWWTKVGFGGTVLGRVGLGLQSQQMVQAEASQCRENRSPLSNSPGLWRGIFRT